MQDFFTLDLFGNEMDDLKNKTKVSNLATSGTSHDCPCLLRHSIAHFCGKHWGCLAFQNCCNSY